MLEGKLSRKGALISAVFMLQAVYAAAATCGGHGDRNTLLVTTSWLQDHLNDKNLVVLAVGPKTEYDKGHIPGSLFVTYADVITKMGERPLTTELPSMEVL